MPEEPLIFNGKKFISSRRAAKISGYTIDYIGQLSRAKKIESQFVGRNRFIGESSLLAYMHQSEMQNGERKVIQDPTPHVIAPPVLPSTPSQNVADIGISDSRDNYKQSHFSSLPRKTQTSSLVRVATAATFLFLLVGFIFSPLGREGVRIIAASFAPIFNELNQASGNSLGAAFETNAALTTDSSLAEGLRKLDQLVLPRLRMVDTFVINSARSLRHKMLALIDNQFGNETVTEQATTTTVAVSTTTTTVLAEQTVSEEEIRRMVYEIFQEEPTIESSPQGGIIALPSTGDPIKDAAMKEKLRNSFSDRVNVSFDESGTAGVIRPVFKQVRGDEYVFVLVPVNQ